MASPSRTKATPDRIIIAERERAALELRTEGVTFEVIARFVGYSHRGSAHRAVTRALAATVQEPADELRRLELERCDALQSAVWPKALEGDAEAVRACLRVMARRSQLLELDSPTRRVANVVTEDSIDVAIWELEAELAEHDDSDVAGAARDLRRPPTT